jgi:hypothetical protein
VGEGDGFGVGVAVGVGDGFGVGVAVGVGAGVGDGTGVGVTVGDGFGVGVTVGDGFGVGVTVGDGFGLRGCCANPLAAAPRRGVCCPPSAARAAPAPDAITAATGRPIHNARLRDVLMLTSWSEPAGCAGPRRYLRDRQVVA